MASNEGVVVNTQKPGVVIKPLFNLSQIVEAASQVYGFCVTSYKQLNSYDDINVLAEVSEIIENVNCTKVSSHGYLIKVINSVDSQQIEIFDGQMAMMEHLRSHGISAPRPVHQKNGRLKCFISQCSMEKQLCVSSADDQPYKPVGDEDGYLMFCLEYLPGRTLHSVPYTYKLIHQTGLLLGDLTLALQSFFDPGLKKMKKIWNMDQAGRDLLHFTFAVKNDRNRALVEEIFCYMQTEVLDKPDGLRRGCIHADFNEQNIIVTASPNEEEYECTSIIDYGDSHEDYVVMDLCTWLAYIIMLCKNLSSMEAAGHVLAGFLLRFELTAAEKRVLRIATAARMAQSLTLGAYSYMSQPGNNDYLLTTAVGWPKLREFWALTDSEVFEKWNGVLEDYGLQL